MHIDRLQPAATLTVDGLLRIYREAIPESERKSDDALRDMLQREDYEFLVALDGGDVTGFSIVKRFEAVDAGLLEYMAVDRRLRGQGIGGHLFRAACATPAVITRYVLLEVDSEADPGPDRAIRARRMAFYRALGCRQVTGLSYLMPSVTTLRPPAMNILLYHRALPTAIDKSRLRGWLQCVYSEVYQRPADDPRIATMLSSMPAQVALQ